MSNNNLSLSQHFKIPDSKFIKLNHKVKELYAIVFNTEEDMEVIHQKLSQFSQQSFFELQSSTTISFWSLKEKNIFNKLMNKYKKLLEYNADFELYIDYVARKNNFYDNRVSWEFFKKEEMIKEFEEFFNSFESFDFIRKPDAKIYHSIKYGGAGGSEYFSIYITEVLKDLKLKQNLSI